MLRTSAKVYASRPFFFLQICVAAISTSSCSLMLDDRLISDPTKEEEIASPEPATIDENKVAAVPSPPAEEEASAVKPDSEQGFYHVLRRGETPSSLSRLYDVPLGRLLKANQITNASKIRAGRRIFIPKPSSTVRLETLTTAELAWPLRGRITGPFGPRGKRSLHCGIDIGGQMGDEVAAAASGTVVQAGTKRKYGKTVVIEHGDGLTTLYAHMSKLLVRVGDQIERGDPIAAVGRSGNARGAHLHFEVRRHDQPVDPISYLDKGTLVATSSR
jgi:murein DD-endopeptidase MepM/ murein hydrolase activator NlpD